MFNAGRAAWASMSYLNSRGGLELRLSGSPCLITPLLSRPIASVTAGDGVGRALLVTELADAPAFAEGVGALGQPVGRSRLDSIRERYGMSKKRHETGRE